MGGDLPLCYDAKLAGGVAGQGWPQLRAELAAWHPSLQPWECSAGASPSSPPLASSTDLSCPVLVSQTWAPAPQVGSALQRNPLCPKMPLKSQR